MVVRIIFLFGLLFLPLKVLISQPYTSKDNYSGSWETPSSWNPQWALPLYDIKGYDIIINGYITANDTLSFSGASNNLIVNDTLVIRGGLLLDNNNDLTINNNGVLIILGDFSFGNQSNIIANGYLIVTGNIIKQSSVLQGIFTSNDDPVKTFIGGTISLPALTDNNLNYPVLNCIAPTTIPYLNSTCSYGNAIDLQSDPIYSFMQSICSTTNVNSDISVCDGDTIKLTSSGGTSYSWSGPNGFTSIARNPSIPNANSSMAGAYTISVTTSSGCTDTDITNVLINELPLVNITSSSSSLCLSGSRTLAGSPAGGTFIISNGPGMITGNILTASGIGNVSLEYIYTSGCTNKATQSIVVTENPMVDAGPDQELEFVFETQMNAVLSSSETGEWSLISGAGYFNDINSPTTIVTGLSLGENIFSWKVQSNDCEVSSEVSITVNDLFVPSVITPNGDGINDYFKVSGIMDGQAQLIIINPWGIIEYSNDNYLNDWNGRDNKERDLPGDTYFYVLKFVNGTIYKGSVLIKR